VGTGVEVGGWVGGRDSTECRSTLGMFNLCIVTINFLQQVFPLGALVGASHPSDGASCHVTSTVSACDGFASLHRALQFSIS
jgi:hypothetical protein